MHPIADTALAVLRASEARREERLKTLDPLMDKEACDAAVLADPRKRLIEVNVAEWRDFLKEFRPQSGRAKEIHETFALGLLGVMSAPVVYVQCVDVLAVYEAAKGQPASETEE